MVFLLISVFLFVNLKKKPFTIIALNDLETISLATSMITIYCGIFFLSDVSEEEALANKSKYCKN